MKVSEEKKNRNNKTNPKIKLKAVCKKANIGFSKGTEGKKR